MFLCVTDVWVGGWERGWESKRMGTIVCAGIRVVTHVYTVQCVFMKARDPEWEREIKRKNGEGLQRICGCVCAQPVSLIGQMSCVPYKRVTLVRWEAVNPGIRSVGQQSTRPQGGLSGWLTGGMEPMCHVDHVWETEGLGFVCYSHDCPVKSVISTLPAIGNYQHRQKHTLRWGDRNCLMWFNWQMQKDYLTKWSQTNVKQQEHTHLF